MHISSIAQTHISNSLQKFSKNVSSSTVPLTSDTSKPSEHSCAMCTKIPALKMGVLKVEICFIPGVAVTFIV